MQYAKFLAEIAFIFVRNEKMGDDFTVFENWREVKRKNLLDGSVFWSKLTIL